MNILKDWNLFEKLWLVIFIGVILAVSIIFDDTLIGTTASITGVLCVILVAKGKISNYFFGAINTALYAYISYQTQLYGEVMLNALFYFPIQFIGFYMWKRNMSKNELGVSTVKAKTLTLQGWIYVIGTVGIVGVLYSLFLNYIGGQQATIDSFTTVLSITAQLLMLKRFAEQWLLWIVVNILTIILWANVFFTDGNSVTILVMWIAYLVNSVYGYIKWRKLAKDVA